MKDKAFYFEKIDSDSDANQFIVINSQFIKRNYYLPK